MSARQLTIILTLVTFSVATALALPVSDDVVQRTSEDPPLTFLGTNLSQSEAPETVAVNENTTNSSTPSFLGSAYNGAKNWFSSLWSSPTAEVAPASSNSNTNPEYFENPLLTKNNGTNTIVDTTEMMNSTPSATENPVVTNKMDNTDKTKAFVSELNTDQDALPTPDDVSDEPSGKVDLTALQSMMFAGGLAQNTANWANVANQSNMNYEAAMSQFAGSDPKMMQMMAILQLVFGVIEGVKSEQMNQEMIMQLLMGTASTFMQAQAIKKQQDELEDQKDKEQLMAGIGAGSSIVGGLAGFALGGPVGGAVGMGLGNAATQTAAPFVMGKKVVQEKARPTLYVEYPVQSTNCGVHSATPIVLDLNRNGRPDLYDSNWRADSTFDPRGAVSFDIDGDGELEFCEWLVPNADGLLVLDKNSDGLILGQKELFGNSEGYANGFRKLQDLLDENHDGYITGRELLPLKVWIDDGDGKSEEGELHSLSSLGITHIGVEDKDLECFYTMNGQDYKTWDWYTEYIQ